MRIRLLLVVILPLLSFALFAEDEIVTPESKFALGVNAGTKGIGLDGLFNLNDHFNLRLSYSQFNTDEDFDEDGISYSGDLDLDTSGLSVEYYPFAGDFRIAAGYYNNGSAIAAEAQPSSAGTVNINGFDYNISGEFVRSDLDWDSGAPYIGLGWGNAFVSGSGFSFAIDVGVLLTDEPTAILSASDGLFDQATILGRDLNQDISAEETALNKDLSEFDIYPVLQLGFTYSF